MKVLRFVAKALLAGAGGLAGYVGVLAALGRRLDRREGSGPYPGDRAGQVDTPDSLPPTGTDR